MRRLVLASISCVVCFAVDVPPDTIHLAKHLERFRNHKLYEMPAAEYRPIQREYLAWINSRVNGRSTFAQMNKELKAANLLSDAPQDVDDYDKNYAGFLGGVSAVPLRDADDLFAIQFGVHTGSYCNFDQTVAIYNRKPFRLLTTLNAELSYTHGFGLSEVAAGKKDAGHSRLLAADWVASNCTSTWNGNIFRIDRLMADNSVENILSEGVSVHFGEEMKIGVAGDTVTFEYVTGIINMVVARAAIERYQIQGGQLTRLAPIAPSFGGFVGEWLRLSDTEAARWGNPEASARHHELAERFKGKFFEWTRSAICPGSPPLREISIQESESKQTAHFRISGLRPEEMRMESSLDKPSPECQEIDIRKNLTSILNEPK